MNYLKIGGKIWDVSVMELSENFTILYSDNSGRTVSKGARMHLDPLGTFYGHKVVVKRKKGREIEFDNLFDYVSRPRSNGVFVEAVHGQKTIEYEAYISQGQRKLKRIDLDNNIVYWDGLEINLIPMEAQVMPE